MQKKRAFTLVELLVVIAIIALLLSILMPALSRVRKQAKTVVCGTNIRQLNLGMRLYVDDNRELTPPITYAQGQYWFHLIAPYLGTKKDNNQGVNLKTGFCPEAIKISETWKDTAPWGTRDRAWLYTSGATSGSYAMNFWLCPMGDYSPFDSDKTSHPDIGPAENYYMKYSHAQSDVPIFSDSIWVGTWPLSGPRTTGGSEYIDQPAKTLDGESGGDFDFRTRGMTRLYIDRHVMAINVGFADASVRKVALADLWMLKWNKNFKCGAPPVVRKGK